MDRETAILIREMEATARRCEHLTMYTIMLLRRVRIAIIHSQAIHTAI